MSPLRNGRPLAAGDRPALVIAGTGKTRTDDPVVFCKVVAVASARDALGPGPLEEPQDIVLRASHREHDERDWRAVTASRL